MSLRGVPLAAVLLLLAASCIHGAKSLAPSKKIKRKPSAARIARQSEVVMDEIKSQTQQFLLKRGQSLFIPVQVDILLLGFDGDGAYGYSLDSDELEEALSKAHSEKEICPTILETQEQAAVCFNVNYMMLTAPDEGIRHVEQALRYEMARKGNITLPTPRVTGDTHEVETFDVEASGYVEEAFKNILELSYIADDIPLPGMGKGPLSEHRLAVLILNPSKLRMSPHTSIEAGAELADIHADFVEEWKGGRVDEKALLEQEAGFVYRYTYNKKGSAASWVSAHNFVVIDLSAGPTDYGPLASPGGRVTPVALPRILPMLLRMARDIEEDQPITLHTHMLEEAAEGQHAIQVGLLAEVVASATHHVFCPDIQMTRIEYARRVLVPIIVIHDDEDFDAVSGGTGIASYRYMLNMGMVQDALDVLVDTHQSAVQEVRSSLLHNHPDIAAALHKARVSRSDAVMLSDPELGLHKSQHVHLDSDVLLRELLKAVPALTDDALEVLDPEEAETLMEASLAEHARHQGTRVIPVFVLSLSGPPDQLLLDNHQLVASNEDAVVVLQMTPHKGNSTVEDEDEEVFVYTGHMQNGKHVKLNAAEGVTANVIAGLATSMAGIVPTYQRYNQHERQLTQDWRWSVGALPWGPYASSTQLSSIFTVTARRNIFVSHVESAIRVLQNRLDAVDALVEEKLRGPFAFLEDELEAHRGGNPRPYSHWLNALANQSHGFNDTLSPDVVQRLEMNLADVESQLERISWSLYAHNFEEAEEALPGLMAAVDLFSKHSKIDMEAMQDAVACCRLHNGSSNFELVLIIGGLALILVVGAIILSMAVCGVPGGSGGGGGSRGGLTSSAARGGGWQESSAAGLSRLGPISSHHTRSPSSQQPLSVSREGSLSATLFSSLRRVTASSETTATRVPSWQNPSPRTTTSPRTLNV